MEDKEEKIYELDINVLQSNPLQPRGVMQPHSLDDLVDSIREQGILEPLVIAKTPAGYQIIAGERRYRAAKILGLSKVPVVVKETSPQGMLEMSIVENVQREDLNPIERGLAYKRLIDDFGLSTGEVARRVGKSAPTVSNTIRLLSLPDAIKDALVAGVISEGHVRPLISLGDNQLMLDLFKRILRENYTARQTEDEARKVKVQVRKEESYRRVDKRWMPEFDKMVNVLEQKLNADKVIVSQSRILAKVIILLRGDADVTWAKLKNIHKIVSGEDL